MPSPAVLQHNVVTTTSSGGTPNTVTAAFGSNVTAGSKLLAAIGTNLAAASVSGITDSQGNTWTKFAAQSGTALEGELWITSGAAGATSLTITITGTTAARTVTVDLVEVSNADTSLGIFGGIVTTASGNSTSPGISSTGASLPAVEFIYAVVFRGAVVGPTGGPTNSFNSLDEVHTQNPAVISAYLVSPFGGGSFSTNWTTAAANYVAIGFALVSGVAARVPYKRYSRQRQQIPARKRLVNRIHEEPSPLGAAVLFAPVKRPRSRRRRVARVEQPRQLRSTRFKGSVFNLLTFFFVVPRRNRKLPKKYILHAAPAPPVRPPVRRKLSASLATMMLFVRVPARRGAAAIARRSHGVRDRLRHFRRFIGVGTVAPPAVVVPPVVIEAPVIAVAQIVAPITGVCVIESASPRGRNNPREGSVKR